MIHALLLNTREIPDASSVTPGSLHSAMARNSTSESDNTALVYNHPKLNNIIMPEYLTVSMNHRYYTIQNQHTLRSLPVKPVCRYRLPDRPLTWAWLSPGNSPPMGRRRDLPGYRQLVSFRRSRRVQMTHTREPVGRTINRHHGPGVKVLVLGISESGKTTLQKAMVIAFENNEEPCCFSCKPGISTSLETLDEDVSLDDYFMQD